MGRRAIFVDRDGTVSEEVGYVNHIGRFRLLPRTADAIRKINDSDFLAVLVTNQAGVARGYFKEELVRRVHAAPGGDAGGGRCAPRCHLLLSPPPDGRRTALP
jgi:histidinol phosphatase-like enzyme